MTHVLPRPSLCSSLSIRSSSASDVTSCFLKTSDPQNRATVVLYHIPNFEKVLVDETPSLGIVDDHFGWHFPVEYLTFILSGHFNWSNPFGWSLQLRCAFSGLLSLPAHLSWPAFRRSSIYEDSPWAKIYSTFFGGRFARRVLSIIHRYVFDCEVRDVLNGVSIDIHSGWSDSEFSHQFHLIIFLRVRSQ